MNARKFLKGCLLPLILLTLLPYVGCTSYNSYTWVGALPKEIKTGRTLERDTPWIAPPGGSCGGAIFTLRKKTQKQILEQGLGYFSDKKVSRRWNKASISWSIGASDRKARISFECVIRSSVKEKYYKDKLTKSMNSVSAYYGVLDSDITRILVLPNEKLVFIGYWD